MKFHTVVNNTNSYNDLHHKISSLPPPPPSKPLAPEFKYLRKVIKWPSSTPDIQHFQHNTACC